MEERECEAKEEDETADRGRCLAMAAKKESWGLQLRRQDQGLEIAAVAVASMVGEKAAEESAVTEVAGGEDGAFGEEKEGIHRR